jgi:hypothetical protein
MANDVHRQESVPGKFEKSDVVLLLGILAAVGALSLILAFARGEHVATLGIVWGWIVNLAIWIYLIVCAI